MNNVLLVFLSLLAVGCAGVQGPGTVVVSVPDPMTASAECNAQLDQLTAGKDGPSLIRERIPNPCAAMRYALAVAKGGIIWDLYKAGALAQWGTEIKEKLAAAQLTYADLNLLLSREILKFNKQLGGTYLMLTELALQFPEQTLLTAQDQAILNAGIDIIVAEARRLATLPIG